MALDQQQAQGMMQKIMEIFKDKDLPTIQKMYGLALEALKNPESYPKVMQQAKQTGIPTESLPQQYNEKFVKSIVFALQMAMQGKQMQSGAQQPQQPQPQLQMPKTL